jgi:hypothetical protein
MNASNKLWRRRDFYIEKYKSLQLRKSKHWAAKHMVSVLYLKNYE